MNNIIEFVKTQTTIVKIIIVLVLLVIYVVFAVLLNKLNNAKHGKSSKLAWIPGLNLFLLGKLVIHWLFGILLILGFLFGIIVVTNIKGLEVISNLLPREYTDIYVIGYLALIVVLVIMAKLKLNKIIRDGTGVDNMSSFVSKKFQEEKKPEVVVDKKEEVVEQIQDNYQYNSNPSNHTSLKDLNNQNNNEENPK